ncbi:MAG: protein kinase [Bryobacterales bacterium]|nr:protein kinase [Bryobacterales bacterium]
MIGETLLHYRIVERIGAGGMGVVYKAVDSRLEREAAIKVLADEQSADAITRQRFLREARSASSLNHPNIVTVYEVNSDRGITFIAMEFISGQTLARRMQEGRLSGGEIRSYATQLAEGLARAHSQGVVHRDLKPKNLMITADGILKILDFGLARVVETDPSMETVQALTVAGSVMGTPGYMSPEQSLGDVADARSDVFSYGVILYEMVTGARPFVGDTVPRILRAVVAEAPRPMESWPAGLPVEWKETIARCLEKEKEKRYATAGDLLREWKAALPPEQGAPAMGFHKKRVGLWVGAGAAAGLLAAGAWVGFSSKDPPPAQETVDLNARPQELVTEGRRLFASFYKAKHVDMAASAFEAAIRQDPANAAAHAGLAEVYLRRNINGRDPQWVKLAEQHAIKAAELNPVLASALVALGKVQGEKGDRKGGLTQLGKALDLDPRNHDAYVAMGKMQAAERDPAAAEASFAKAIEIAPGQWLPYVEAGIFYFRQGKYGEAQRTWEKAGKLTPDNDLVWRNLSGAYLAQDRFDEAAAAIQKALEILPTAPHYSNLGYIRFYQGRYMDAIEPFEKARDMMPSRHLYWGNLGDAYRWTPGKERQAKEAFTTALRLAREALVNSPADGDLRSSVAVFLAKSGEKQEALAEVASMEKVEKLTPGAVFKLAVASEIGGNRGQALRLLERALASGYVLREVKTEPEFTALRKDVRYHQLLGRFPATSVK